MLAEVWNFSGLDFVMFNPFDRSFVFLIYSIKWPISCGESTVLCILALESFVEKWRKDDKNRGNAATPSPTYTIVGGIHNAGSKWNAVIWAGDFESRWRLAIFVKIPVLVCSYYSLCAHGICSHSIVYDVILMSCSTNILFCLRILYLSKGLLG